MKCSSSRSGLRVATLEEVAHYGGTLPRGLRAPIAGAAGPALANGLGGNTNGISNNTTLSITPAAAVPVGQLVLVNNDETSSTSTINNTDTGGNTYTVVQTNYGASGNTCGMGYSYVTTALTTSSSVSFSTTAGNHKRMLAASFTGCAGSPYGLGTASSFGTTPSVSTSVSVNGGDLVVAFWITSGSATAAVSTMPSGWGATTGASFNTSGNSGGGAWLVPSSSGTVTFNPTMNSSQTYDMSIIAFPAAVIAPTNTAAPAVTGTPVAGQTLSCSTGSWS